MYTAAPGARGRRRQLVPSTRRTVSSSGSFGPRHAIRLSPGFELASHAQRAQVDNRHVVVRRARDERPAAVRLQLDACRAGAHRDPLDLTLGCRVEHDRHLLRQLPQRTPAFGFGHTAGAVRCHADRCESGALVASLSATSGRRDAACGFASTDSCRSRRHTTLDRARPHRTGEAARHA